MRRRDKQSMKHTYKLCEALWFVFPLHTYEVDRYSSCYYQTAHACTTTVSVLQSENYMLYRQQN